MVFREYKSCWAHLIPSSSTESSVLAEHFFSTACSLMARLLREAVEKSLTDFVTFLAQYEVSLVSPAYNL